MFTIAFTGKRPKELYGCKSYKDYEPLAHFIRDTLQTCADADAANGETLKIVTGAAQGVDQLAFWAANILKTQGYDIIQHVCIPFGKQPSQWRQDGPFGQSDYQKMLRIADEVTNLEDFNDDNMYALYNIRNEYMVNMADRVIAIAPAHDVLNGGTGHAVKYTLQCGKPIKGIDPFRLVHYKIGG